MLPLTKSTDATPQKTPDTQPLAGLPTPKSSSDAPTPASSGDPYRLLYRGALSLPDSYLQLDGITFSARLPNRHASTQQDSPSCSRTDASAKELMYNPLTLALESMRGRQSLRFKGTVSLEDVWTDDTGDVYMDIHPCATLTQVYFENILCLSPLGPPQDTFGPRRTQVGVRVSLGDTDGPETMDIVVYGETSVGSLPPPLQLSSAASTAGPPPLSLRVARITPVPRAPRPDDPTPRQPPTHFGNTTLSDLGKNTRITPRTGAGNKGKSKDKETADDHVLRRAREVMLHLPRSHADGHGKTRDKAAGRREAVFKVPEVPAKACRKQGRTGTDVFGTVELPQPSANEKDKTKTSVEDGTAIADPIEAANKLVLKKLAVHCLSTAGIPRSHSEFKDIFGFVYRGASFALRSQMRIGHLSAQAAEGAIEAHVKMYV